MKVMVLLEVPEESGRNLQSYAHDNQWECLPNGDGTGIILKPPKYWNPHVVVDRLQELIIVAGL